MPDCLAVYNIAVSQTLFSPDQLPDSLRPALREALHNVFACSDNSVRQVKLQQELHRLSKLAGQAITQDFLVALYREEAGQHGLPPFTTSHLQKIQLKPMRSQSGVQTVSVLTKPFPCPGQCIFCPNDIRMPKSYIASEPGAQRAERNSFDPYLQTYSRLKALRNMGHQPTKIELIVLGGTWSYYPESYQIWFIHECFRALNDFGSGQDDTASIQQRIDQTVTSAHRQANRVIQSDSIRIDGQTLTHNYNQVVSTYYLKPEIEVEGGLEVRRETKTWEELWQQHTLNETSDCRCVGLTIETRPDNISAEEIIRLRQLGCTKTQIGFQSLSDDILALNKRGHDTAATRRAVQLLRQAGFKIHAHWMPNLYGSNLEHDKQEFQKLFQDPAYRPDELKIYPCVLIPSAELMQYYQDGRWQPYPSEALAELLAFCLLEAPPWVRLNRVVRDIPDQETMTQHLPTNLRQIVQDQLQAQGKTLPDIRGREIRRDQPAPPIELQTLSYTTTSSEERFLQFVDRHNRLLGFLRLSLPKEAAYIPELIDHAIIRELHVYGQVEPLGQTTTGQTQHRGYGKKLIHAAKEQARAAGYQTLSVISAVGTRRYYEKLGFTRGKLYQEVTL